MTDLHATLGAAFFGFSAGAILYGITIRQAYQYYTTSANESVIRKSVIAIVCSLDTFHLVFSMYLVYNLILQLLGYSAAGPNVLWSLKVFFRMLLVPPFPDQQHLQIKGTGLGSGALHYLSNLMVILIVFVQGFYLFQIWKLSGNMLLARRFAHAVQFFVIFISLFALAVGIIFFSQLQRIEVILSFSSGFEYVVYLGFGATALVDCAIAAAMCIILHKSSAGTERSETVLESLIQYFIGSGLLTSFAAILCIILYVVQPNTLLYLGMEFSVTRLYANSVLAMFNARHNLREKLNETMELKLPSGVFFVEPDQMSQNMSLIGSNPFSPGEETKYSECDCSIRGHKEGSMQSRGYTV
ncbi:hypothetical protein GALMADRAFT_138346 [Galerina marginata CBS 339.88]|uniref:DUF6534 domain-containing protein n=1 Tax=Galerina marginata (strain CBS 339.88) TaxID=685588 RepID=A0A067TE90_GALM3|nr:hypothetical protein GALMADRAFT_138346 [Galerina marginata CBS 339.88]